MVYKGINPRRRGNLGKEESAIKCGKLQRGWAKDNALDRLRKPQSLLAERKAEKQPGLHHRRILRKPWNGQHHGFLEVEVVEG